MYVDFTTPCGLVDTCQAEIDQHQQLESEKLIPLKSSIIFLREEGEQLTIQKGCRDKEVVMNWIKDIEMRFSELLAKYEWKQVKLFVFINVAFLLTINIYHTDSLLSAALV